MHLKIKDVDSVNTDSLIHSWLSNELQRVWLEVVKFAHFVNAFK